MKIRRVLEYIGEESWIRSTLARSLPTLGDPLVTGGGSVACVQQDTEYTSPHEDRHFIRRGLPFLVYIAGRFAGDTPEAHEANVAHAAGYRAQVAALGAYPVCPHTNTQGLGGPLGQGENRAMTEFWYDGSCELLRRCDALLLIPGWEQSRGSQRERAAAGAWGIPVFVVDTTLVEPLQALRLWLAER